jgi:tRNA 2-thiouridine synthesizing protein A
MSETDERADVTVDAVGSSCPGPLMDLIGKMKSVDSGTVVELLSSNEGTEKDLTEWTEQSGHELVDIVDHGDHQSYYVRKR